MPHQELPGENMIRKIIALLIAPFLLAGCGLITVVEADHSQHGGLLPNLTDFSMNDLMFAQMMIPHHEQAIQMAEWAKTRASDPQVKELAEKILAEQAPEIALMTGWLEQARQAVGDHSMHMDMQGMLSEQELAKLKSLTGAEFDRYFLESMVKHHEGAVVMAKDFLDSSNQNVVELLQSIIATQNSEIQKMEDLLKPAN